MKETVEVAILTNRYYREANKTVIRFRFETDGNALQILQQKTLSGQANPTGASIFWIGMVGIIDPPRLLMLSMPLR